MGIDLKAGGRHKNRVGRDSTSSNPYLRLLIKLYKFLARRTDAKFNKAILKRLNQSRVNRYPISLSRLVKLTQGKGQRDRIIATVATVTDDVRLLNVPKLTVCALRFTERARNRIQAAGGQCLTFDQLATKAPNGSGVLLLRGAKRREALKHFGLAPGQKGSNTKPYVGTKGKIDENKK